MVRMGQQSHKAKNTQTFCSNIFEECGDTYTYICVYDPIYFGQLLMIHAYICTYIERERERGRDIDREREREK